LLHHVLLKAVCRPDLCAEYLDAAYTFDETYRREAPEIRDGEWLRLTWPTTGALVLARVDGKSPVEYLTSRQQEWARQLGGRLLLGQTRSWDALARFYQDIASHQRGD
jgi:hypothetical protein